jgi:hypothetical protein
MMWDQLVGTSTEQWSAQLASWGTSNKNKASATSGPNATSGTIAETSMAKTASGASLLMEHGLSNEGGANHCFLNVSIQALWNLSSFRERFLNAPEHDHDTSLTRGISNGPQDSKVEESENLADPLDSPESCCFCALKIVFKQYQFSEADTLPPDALRETMAYTYNTSGRFQLGEMEDATETIEALLDVLHLSHMYAPKDTKPRCMSACCDKSFGSPSSSSTDTTYYQGGGYFSDVEIPQELRRRLSEQKGASRIEEASNFACQPLCIGHEVFGIETVDLPRCTFCAATGEPTVISSFLYCVYVAELLEEQGRPQASIQREECTSTSTVSDQVSRFAARWTESRPQMQDVLRKLCQRSVSTKCNECNSRHTIVSERWLTRRPHTFAVSLVWPTSTPTRDSIWLVISSIQPQMYMEQIFKTDQMPTNPEEVGINDNCEPYYFRGLICYYGMHYVAFFYCWARKKWVLFDDTRVQEENDWSSVASIIVDGHFVPTVVFFERLHDSVSEEAIEELARQVKGLEERHVTCSAM